MRLSVGSSNFRTSYDTKEIANVIFPQPEHHRFTSSTMEQQKNAPIKTQISFGPSQQREHCKRFELTTKDFLVDDPEFKKSCMSLKKQLVQNAVNSRQ